MPESDDPQDQEESASVEEYEAPSITPLGTAAEAEADFGGFSGF